MPDTVTDRPRMKSIDKSVSQGKIQTVLESDHRSQIDQIIRFQQTGRFESDTATYGTTEHTDSAEISNLQILPYLVYVVDFTKSVAYKVFISLIV
jgi:hypothetical protein